MVPQKSRAKPRMAMAVPMVIMMRVTSGAEHRTDERCADGEGDLLVGNGQHRSQHDELALGQIDHPGDVVDRNQAQGNEHVDASRAKTGDQQLKVVAWPILRH